MLIEQWLREVGPPRPVALVPELVMHQVDDLDPLWLALQDRVGGDVPPPFWACVWPGGQAVARYVLDNPGLVAGRAVLDVAAGGGVVALAAARAGAASVVANDVDPTAGAAMAANAVVNGLVVTPLVADLLDGPPPDADVLLIGDASYEDALAVRVLAFMRRCRAAGADVILGDPRRTYFPEDALDVLARYEVPVSVGVEGRAMAPSVVGRLRG